MKINRLSLIGDLDKALPGIATGTTTIEGADNIVFSNGHIYTYNTAISVDVAQTNESDLKGVVKGEDFYKCLKKLPSDEIEIESEPKENVWKIIDGKIKVTMNLIPNDDIFDRFDSVKPTDNWQPIDGKEFNEALQLCNMPSNKGPFAGIYISNDFLLSTDGFIINKYALSKPMPDLWISNSVVQELKKWDNFTEFQINKVWLQFKSADGVIFSVRTLDITRFPIERISAALEEVKNITPEFTSEFTKDFYLAVDRAAAFSYQNDEHEVINFDIGPEGSKVYSSRISGSYEENVTDIKSETPFNLKLDISIIHDCISKFSKFSLIKRDGNFNIVMTRDNSIKLFSVI